jgi:hypothetical protein
VLSPEDVGNILRLLSYGMTQASVGKIYRVTQPHISKIATGRKWA